MSLLATSLLALLPLAAPGPSVRPDDVATRLAELSSPSAEIRARAERWLSVHVGRGDFPELAETVARGDAEVRRRVARIVGAEERQLALAVDFALEAEPELREVGELAIGEMLTRWNSNYPGRPPAGPNELGPLLEDLFDDGRPVFLRLDVAAPLDELVDLLARHGDLPVGLVIEPRLLRAVDERLAPDPVPYVGTWDQLVLRLAELRGLAVEALGADPEEPPGGGVVLRYVSRGDEGRTPGTDTIVRWCRGAAEGEDAVRAPRAMALVRTGWPAALTWLEARWRTRGDPAAREAVLTAAALGRRVPSLASAEVVQEVFALGRARIAAGDLAGADRCMRALAAGVCVTDQGAARGRETRLAEVLLAPWGELDATGRLFVLSALEGLACPLEEAELARIADLFAAPPGTHSAALLRQGLRAWIACRGTAGRTLRVVADPAGLFAPPVRGVEARREVVELLLTAGVPPPDAAAGVPAEAVFEWRLGAGRVDAAARGLLDDPELLAPGGRPRPERAAGVLAAWLDRGDAPRVEELLAACRRRADGERLRDVDRLALLAGALEPDRHAEFLEEGFEEGLSDGGGAGRLALLAALAAEPTGAAGRRARTALLERLVRDLKAGVPLEGLIPALEAVERATGTLLHLGADGVAEGLRSEAHGRVLFDGRASPAYSMLRASGWPPYPPARRVTSLGALERSLAP